MPHTMNILLRHYAFLAQLARLPVARLQFHAHLHPDNINTTYRIFTKRHPRYKIIRNKTIGAALIDLHQFDTLETYLDSIKGKNLGAYHAKRARSRGYRFDDIDRNGHVDAIHEINTALEDRQGRPMDQHYLEKKQHFESLSHFRYCGILDANGRLQAYCNYAYFGNFVAFSQLMGKRNNDGIMHLMVVEIVARLIAEGKVKYLMYDTFFGARAGLQQFKTILGFKPYRAKYSLQ